MAISKLKIDFSSTVTLNDGVEMPLFGIGFDFEESDDEEFNVETAVISALQIGYRMIDTCNRNEVEVGRAIKKSKVERGDIFIVARADEESRGYKQTIQSVKNSLKNLDTPYIDLYLTNSPMGGKNIGTYQALLDMKNEGKIRSVGLLNYDVHHLEGLWWARLRPRAAVNMMQVNIYQRQQQLSDYCLKRSIVPMTYSLTKDSSLSDDPDLRQIAERANKTVEQVMIRWNLQCGYATILRSTSVLHGWENSHIFDFALTKEEMQILNIFRLKLPGRMLEMEDDYSSGRQTGTLRPLGLSFLSLDRMKMSVSWLLTMLSEIN